MIPLIFLAISAILNIGLDLFFVIVLKLGVEGAAIATVISQYLSGIGSSIYSLIKNIQVRAIMKLQYFHLKRYEDDSTHLPKCQFHLYYIAEPGGSDPLWTSAKFPAPEPVLRASSGS